MATFKTDDLVKGLNAAILAGKKFLAISKETSDQIDAMAKSTKKFSEGLDVSKAKGLQDFNSELEKTNKLVKLKNENDKESKKVELDLIKVEKALINAIAEEEKLNQQKIKTKKSLSEAGKAQELADRELIKTEKELSKALEQEEKLNQQKIKTKNILRAQELKEIKEKERLINLKKKAEKQESDAIAKAKKLSAQLKDQNTAYRQLTKNTNEAQLELKQLSAEFGVGSKQAKKAQKQFEKFDNELREINEHAKDGRRDVGRYRQEVGKLADEMKNAANKAGGFGDVISTVTSPVGLATAAASGLAASFLSTEKGGNKAKDVLAGLEGGLNAATASLGGFINTWIETGSVTEAYSENLDGVVEKVKKQSKANVEATQTGRSNRIELRETSEELAKLRGEYELLSQQAGDSTTTLEAQQDATIKQAEKAAEITNQELVVLDKQKDLIELQLSAREGKNNADLLDERQEIINQQIELEGQLTADLATIGQERNQIQQDQWEQRLDFLFDASDRQKSITEKQLEDESISTEKRKQLLIDLKDNIKETYDEIEKEFQDASGNQIKIAEFANLEAIEQAKLLETLNLSEIERNRLKEAVVEYLQVVQDLDEAQSDLNDVEEESLSLQKQIAIQRRKLSGEDIEVEKEFTELKKEELQAQINLLEVGSIERLKKQKELNSILLKEQSKFNDESEKQDVEVDDGSEREKELAEERKRILQEATDFAIDQINRINENKQKGLQNELDQSLRNQDIIQRGIEAGSKIGEQSLAREKKLQADREAEIQRLESKALKLNALIALLQVWGNTGDVNEALTGFAVVKSAADTVDSASYEGTDYVGSTGSETKVHGGKDGHRAALHTGEIVLNNKQADEMRSLGFGTRDSMLDLARMSDIGVDKGGNLVSVVNDNALVVARLDKQNELLEALPKLMPIHNTGLTDDPRYMEEIIKRGNITNKLKRRAKGTWKR